MILILYFDGLAEPNPGTASYGWLIKRNGDELASGKGLLVRRSTNNEAEYTALIRGLEALVERGLVGEEVEVRGDSQLVIKQMAGHWRVNSPHLRPLCQEAMTLARQIGPVAWSWVPREQNEEADSLSREAYQEVTGQDPDYSPDCPRCGEKMFRRRGRYGEFWGCSQYPACRGTLASEVALSPLTGQSRKKVGNYVT